MGENHCHKSLNSKFPASLLETEIVPSSDVKNLGFLFDNDHSFMQDVNKLGAICYYLKDLQRIRRYLNADYLTLMNVK